MTVDLEILDAVTPIMDLLPLFAGDRIAIVGRLTRRPPETTPGGLPIGHDLGMG